MTHDLRDQLDDLVADVPAYVVPDARAAWAAGSRRRTRARLAVGAVAAVVAIIAGAVLGLPRTLDPAPADSRGAGVDGYPGRIDQPWILRDLPDRPGAVAAVLETDDGYQAVYPSGRVRRLPRGEGAGDALAVSADGTRLAYFRGADEFVLRDLTTGAVEVADGVGDSMSSADRPEPTNRFEVALQSPAFWSPTGDRVFVVGGSADDPNAARALLVGPGDTTTAVAAPLVRGDRLAWPAGWTPTGDLVWLAGDSDRDEWDQWAVVVVTTTSGREVDRIKLDVPRGLADLGQWSGSISPDGTRLAVVGYGETPTVFSVEDGSLIGRSGDVAPTCAVAWQDNEPAVSVVIDPALHDQCAVWAADALDGPRHLGVSGLVFGDRDTWLAWHRQEMLLVGLGVAGTVLLVVRRRRTRVTREDGFETGLRPSSTTEDGG